MSLRKSPALTPALLEACRRNARKSRGPRTPQGKANVRMNALRGRGHSELYRQFWEALYFARPGGMTLVARRLLNSDLAKQADFRTLAEVAIECELPAKEQVKILRRERRRRIGRQSYFLRTIRECLSKQRNSKMGTIYAIENTKVD